MKINSISINGVVFPVVNTQIISLDGCFKADLVVADLVKDGVVNFETSNIQDFEIKGTNVDFSDLLIDNSTCASCAYFERKGQEGNWSLLHVDIDLK